MKNFQEQASFKADGIGFQSHFSINNLRGMEDLWRRYQRFAPLVDRLVVTEYDFVCNDDELHADYLRDVLTLSFSHPKMTAFINWGFWAGYHWKPEGTLIRKDWTERPAIKYGENSCATRGQRIPTCRQMPKDRWKPKHSLVTMKSLFLCVEHQLHRCGLIQPLAVRLLWDCNQCKVR